MLLGHDAASFVVHVAAQTVGNRMGRFQHLVKGFRHVMGTGKCQEEHETLGGQLVHILKIEDPRLHHIRNAELYGGGTALSLAEVEEIHIAKPQPTAW